MDLPTVTQPAGDQAGAGPTLLNPDPAHPQCCALPLTLCSTGLLDGVGQGEKPFWHRACPAVEVSCDLAAMAELAGTICSHSAGTWTSQAWWHTSSAVQAPGNG